jgi:hypothetical protein
LRIAVFSFYSPGFSIEKVTLASGIAEATDSAFGYAVGFVLSADVVVRYFQRTFLSSHFYEQYRMAHAVYVAGSGACGEYGLVFCWEEES